MKDNGQIDEISRRRLLQATGAIGAGGMAALTGCTTSSDGGGGGDTGGTLTIAPSTGPTTLDPHNHRETTTATYLIHFYNGLVTRNQEMEIVPDLATDWSRPDATTWEFSLREGVTFSNGEEFTAETVRYNLRRVSGQLNDKSLPISDLYGAIGSIDAVDTYNVRVNLESPDPLFLENQAGLRYVPKQYTEENGFEALNENPVGTGPYTMEQWERDELMVMSAKEDYFKGAPANDSLEWEPRPEASSRLVGLTSGEVDVIRSVSPQSESEVEDAENAVLKKVRSTRSAALWLNMEQNVFGRDDAVFYDNLSLRKAVNYAIDVESIIENILQGNGTRTHGWAPSQDYLGYNPDIEPYPHDPERARMLRDEAGYDAGELSLTLLVPRERYPSGVATSEAIATMLGNVGINVELNAIEFGEFADQTQQHNMPGLMFAAWGNPTFNALEPYLPLVSSEALFSLLPNNDKQDWVQEVDSKIQTAQTTVDREELDGILQDLERTLHEQAAFVFLFQYQDVYGVNANLNWEPRSDELVFMYNASK